MQIDWAHFTPLQSLAGGILLGIAAALFILLNGRILGISGIIGGLLRPTTGDIAWRVTFLLGLVGSPLLYALLVEPLALHIEAGTITLVVGGLLVGIGTRLGSGCPSGHGICGLSRLSPRSLVATPSFMGAGFITVAIIRHVLGGA